MKRLLLALVALLLPLSAGASTVVPYLGSSTASLPGSSGHYTVSVNGTSVPVFSYSGYSFTWFAFSGTANVAVTFNATVSSYTLSPIRLNIPSTKSGSTISFSLTNAPAKLCLKKVNGSSDYLYVLADPLESSPPASSGSGIYNVVTGYGANNSYGADATSAINSAISAANSAGGGIVYVPAGHYKIGTNGSIHLQSHVNLYLAPGALIQVASGYGGGFHNSSAIYTETDSGAEISGRGVIYGTGTSQGTFFWLFSSEAETSFRIQDVMFLDSQTTGVRIQANGATIENAKIVTLPGRLADGIDMESASNITIDNNLILSTDDNTEFGTGTDSWQVIHPFNNVNITNNLFANLMTGHTFSIAPHTSNSSSGMSNIFYDNNDSIDTDAVIAIYPFGGTPVSNVTFQNFGAENIRGRPFEIWGGDCTDWGPGNCGSPVGVIGPVTNVTVANTNFYTQGSQDSQLYASSSGSPINGMHFNNDTFVGTPVTSASSMHLEINSGNILNLTFSATAGPSITSFTASPNPVGAAGDPVTLSWTAQNATSFSINSGVGPVSGGSVVVHPTVTTTYILTATGSGGSTTTRSVTVTVPTAPPPTISSFTATPASVPAGSSSTLAWSITGATTVVIDNGLGTQSGSSVSVAPASTTTYKITATNSSGSVFKLVTVTVTGNDIYIAGAPTGDADGSDCANAFALSFFNTSGNWGSGAGKIGGGKTVHVCGAVTGTANTTALTFQGSGSSGNLITLKFESGASLSAPYWSPNGAINLNGKSYVVVDGGSNGVIQNTANGTGLANQQTSVGVQGTGATNDEVKNLTIKNIYVNQGSAPGATDAAGVNTVGIQFNGNSTNSKADQNTVSQAKTGIQFAMDSGGDASNIQIFSNKISDVDWGINVGGGDPGDTATGVQIYANDISNWTNWQFPTSAYHQDGIILFNVGNSSAGIVANVYNNYIHGDLGVGSPTGFIYCADFSSCNVYNNLLVNSGHTIDGIIWLGQTSNNGKTMAVYNNTVISTQNDIGITLALSGHATIKNNIFNGVSVGIHDYNTLTSTVTASNNNLWQTTTGAAPQMATADSTFVSYSAWQTDGFDLNSSTAAPNLNASYAPNTGSPVIGLGANLTSLSITSLDFDYAGTPRPATGNWTAGAFQVGGGGGGGGSPAIVSFAATANPINQNSSTTICWSVTGATTISIDQGIGPVTGTCVPVSPSATITYTLSATNSSGTSRQMLTLTVNNGTVPTISSFAASPTSITAGASVTLSWSITGATSLSINNGVGTVTGSSVSVSPTTTTTYIITATNAFGQNTAAAVVTVTAAAVPTISSFTCTPSTIPRGARSTCAWSVTGADSLLIDKGVGTVTGTSIVLAPIVTTTYTLTATNTAGPATLSATITVNNTATQGFFATQIKAADRQGTAAGTKILMTDGTFTTNDIPIYLGDGTAHDSGKTIPVWVKEVPSGTLNGTNTAFTLSFAPIVGSLTLYYGTAVELEGTDFTLSGSTITFASAPASSARFQARYQH